MLGVWAASGDWLQELGVWDAGGMSSEAGVGLQTPEVRVSGRVPALGLSVGFEPR